MKEIEHYFDFTKKRSLNKKKKLSYIVGFFFLFNLSLLIVFSMIGLYKENKIQHKENRFLANQLIYLIKDNSQKNHLIEKNFGYHKIYDSYNTDKYQYYETLKNVSINNFQKVLKKHFFQDKYVNKHIKTYISPYGFPMYIVSDEPLEKIGEMEFPITKMHPDIYKEKSLQKNGFILIKQENKQYLYYTPENPIYLQFKNDDIYLN